MACHIDYLPDEILEYILNLIPPYKDLKECMLVCKRWSHAVKRMFNTFISFIFPSKHKINFF